MKRKSATVSSESDANFEVGKEKKVKGGKENKGVSYSLTGTPPPRQTRQLSPLFKKVAGEREGKMVKRRSGKRAKGDFPYS